MMEFREGVILFFLGQEVGIKKEDTNSRGRYHLRQAFKYKNLCSREVELSGDSLSCKNIPHRVSSLLGPDLSMGSSSVSLKWRVDVERA